jgi:hypothetical protein
VHERVGAAVPESETSDALLILSFAKTRLRFRLAEANPSM